MTETNPTHGCQFAFQLERLYWQATTGSDIGNEWLQEFSRLDQRIKEALPEAERSKLLRLSHAYQRLRQIAADPRHRCAKPRHAL